MAVHNLILKAGSVCVGLKADDSVSMASSVTRFGTTWTFDQSYQVGQFANGDWWVVGPATVNSVSPAPSGSGGTFVNGSMINPDLSLFQGYDGRATAGDYYDSDLTVDYPVTLQPGDSLLSAESREDYSSNENDLMGVAIGSQVYLRAVNVLTCLASAPAATAMRPPYAGTTKTIFDSADINMSLLPSLAEPSPIGSFSMYPVDGQTRAEQYARIFERPWIEHCDGGSNSGQEVRPLQNCPYYYATSFDMESEAACLLCLDEDSDSIGGAAKKKALAIAVAQRGIDSYYLWLTNPNPTQRMGRCMSKWPTLLAGLIFNNSTLKTGHSVYSNSGHSWFKTDACPYAGTGWNGATTLFHIDKHYDYEDASDYNFEEKDPLNPGADPDNWCWVNPVNGKRAWDEDGYRRAIHSVRWVGMALAAKLMGQDSDWNCSLFFDYIKRWMTQSEASYWSDLYTLAANPCGDGSYQGTLYQQGTVPQSEFVAHMWSTHYNAGDW